jgi:ribonuclease E
MNYDYLPEEDELDEVDPSDDDTSDDSDDDLDDDLDEENLEEDEDNLDFSDDKEE